jgi:hypothetical protein
MVLPHQRPHQRNPEDVWTDVISPVKKSNLILFLAQAAPKTFLLIGKKVQIL